MESLQSTSEKVTVENKRAKKLRRYIVVEAVYQNSGQIAPLDEIIRLKEKYRFRVLLDKSNSFGVFGSSGRGITEQYGVPNSVSISSGYVFSASLPPYLPTAAITAIDVLEENPDLITKLNKNIVVLCQGFIPFSLLHLFLPPPTAYQYCWRPIRPPPKSPATTFGCQSPPPACPFHLWPHWSPSPARLSNIHGLKIVSDVKSLIIFLGLKNSTGSLKSDSQLLEHIAEQKNRVFHITTLIVLKQESTSDSCQTLNEEEIFEVQDKYSLIPFGWIHFGFVSLVQLYFF
ncbi:hypothetical protein HYC85_019596 [Camellia sinensis]|uniref:Aminotransferase class I/classII domain-containing protein n=1 Tax=Camellia sinensis TaxID=4442 RepID=A0A7J7GR98_CAMSI|nr:hypothetical protein HYC85_019596 [Camellia sinensis]